MFPPYDEDEGRDCNYYKAIETIEPSAPSAFKLIVINQPDHFHCYTGEYGRFTKCDVATGEEDDDTDMIGMDVSVDTHS